MWLSKTLSDLFFRFSKWDIVVDDSAVRKGAILVGAPHTSNWDFVLMLAIAGQAGIKYKWLGKSNLFRGPAGPLMKMLGGIPVDRSSSSGLVDQMATQFGTDSEYVLAITPKGTRAKREYWHSGFYRIAEKTGMPLLLCFVDSNTNTTGIGRSMEITGNLKADMEEIRRFYAGKTGVRPEMTSTPRLRAEDER